jgi:hypothetical protein
MASATQIPPMPIDPAEHQRLNEITDRVWEQRGLVAIANMRAQGVRDIVVYCADLVCNHSAYINVDPLPDQFCLADLEPRMRCSKCGGKRVSVRPLFWHGSDRPPPKAIPWPAE